MNYIDKEIKLLKALEENKYEIFGGIDTKDRALDALERKFEAFPQYANVVIKEQVMLPIWQFRYDADELRAHIMQIDKERHLAHDFAIKSLDGINEWCKMLKIELFAQIDTSDRHAVAEFVGNFVGETYNIGINKSFDEIVYNKTSEFNTKDVLKKAVEEMDR